MQTDGQVQCNFATSDASYVRVHSILLLLNLNDRLASAPQSAIRTPRTSTGSTTSFRLRLFVPSAI